MPKATRLSPSALSELRGKNHAGRFHKLSPNQIEKAVNALYAEIDAQKLMRSRLRNILSAAVDHWPELDRTIEEANAAEALEWVVEFRKRARDVLQLQEDTAIEELTRDLAQEIMLSAAATIAGIEPEGDTRSFRAQVVTCLLVLGGLPPDALEAHEPEETKAEVEGTVAEAAQP